jgi:branched-chain amino acid transport system ATP-binding protein
MKNLLEVNGLETSYGRSQVLFGIDLFVGEGEVVGLMGRNGMGKSTTIRSIMGFTRTQRGSVMVRGNAMQHLPAFKVARAGVAIVPEGRQVFRQLTVLEHLVMAQVKRTVFAEPWTVEKIFKLFPRLEERQHHFGTQLSGGEQQMLAIGRALMTNPTLIMFDEATEGLAPLIRQEIWAVIRLLKERGYAILVVDKNLHDVAQLAARLYVLEKGRVAWTGAASTLCGQEDLQRRYLGV